LLKQIRLLQFGYRLATTALMQAVDGGTGETIPAAPIANEGTDKCRIRAVMSNDKLEMFATPCSIQPT
jgi:hypothetical protein